MKISFQKELKKAASVEEVVNALLEIRGVKDKKILLFEN